MINEHLRLGKTKLHDFFFLNISSLYNKYWLIIQAWFNFRKHQPVHISRFCSQWGECTCFWSDPTWPYWVPGLGVQHITCPSTPQKCCHTERWESQPYTCKLFMPSLGLVTCSFWILIPGLSSLNCGGADPSLVFCFLLYVQV